MARAALEAAVQLGERSFECEAAFRLAVAMRELGHVDEARVLLQHADALARENGFEAQRPAILATLAGLVPPEEALGLLAEAEDIASRLASPVARAQVLVARAEIAPPAPAGAGTTTDAETLLREAAELSRSLHRPFEEAQARARLGERLVRDAGRRKEGIVLLEESLATFLRLGAHREVARVEGVFSRLADGLPATADPA